MSEKKYEPEIVDLRTLRQRLIRHENWVKDPRAGEPLNLQRTDIRLALREAACAREAGAYQEADPLQNRCLNDADLSNCLGLLPEHLAGSSLVRVVLPSSITYQEMESERRRVMQSHQRFVLAFLLWGVYITLTFFSVPEIRWAMSTARVVLPLFAVSLPAPLFLNIALIPYLFLGLGERLTRQRGNFLRQQMPSHFPNGQPPTPETLPKKLYIILMGSGLAMALFFAVRCLSLRQPMLAFWHALLTMGMLGIALPIPLKRASCLIPLLVGMIGIVGGLVHAPSPAYLARITTRLQAVRHNALLHKTHSTLPEYRTALGEEAEELQGLLARPALPLGDFTPHLVLVEKKLERTDMNGASLQFLEAPHSHWDGSYLIGVDATGACFAYSHLPSVTFTRRTPHPPTRLNFADFTAANLSSIEAEGVEAAYTNFRQATLAGANLRLANLTAANLHKAVLDRANLSGAYLRDADLSEAHASNTQLAGAYASHARLDAANLSLANLHECNLQAASLVRANLYAADLTSADLQDADCSGADFTEAQLDGAIFSSQTLWGSGKPWPDAVLAKQYRALSLTDREGKILPNLFRLEKISQKSDKSDKK
jgi:uncharacterized protein YjbI with pentapeptide repeats